MTWVIEGLYSFDFKVTAMYLSALTWSEVT